MFKIISLAVLATLAACGGNAGGQAGADYRCYEISVEQDQAWQDCWRDIGRGVAEDFISQYSADRLACGDACAMYGYTNPVCADGCQDYLQEL